MAKDRPHNVISLDEYRKKKQKLKSRTCNLCHNEFVPDTKHDRFCKNCKQNDERFIYAEWLNSSSY